VRATRGCRRPWPACSDGWPLERFVRHWLGALLDHDAKNPADLVHTLGLYLAHGGSYDAASKALPVHRSMLK
jgi:DNA-binding PucR family transcriptional regulator